MNSFIGKLNSTQKKFLLLIVGALSALAFAPFEFFPILLFSFPLFFLVLQTATTRKKAFWFGWWFGFGQFLAGLYWICYSLFVDGAEKFLWLVPFAAAGIPAILAIYIGLFSFAFNALTKKVNFSNAAQIFLFVNLWLIFEILRSYLFTGFPWNLLGYTLLANIQIAQIASLGGVFLASWVAIFLALIPLYFRNKKMLLAALLIIISSYIYGVYHINKSEMQAVNKSVVLLQPNHPQSLVYDSEAAERRFEDSLTLMTTAKNADYYIWPEATGIYHLNRSPEAVSAIASVLPDGALAIIGADRSVGETKANYQGWNSMYVISKNGIEAVYDKQHLVPFGEYVPFSDILPLENITGGMVDFSSGIGEKRLMIKDLDAIPLICYEIIFPNYANYNGARPNFIINITNDSWFGNSSGPYQHLAMSRMRAIESGLPVLRAAKTGVSAVVDSFGNLQTKLELNHVGIATSEIPDKIKSVSIYGEYGFLIVFFLVLSSSVILIFIRKK